jgi:hypothetical protein
LLTKENVQHVKVNVSLEPVVTSQLIKLLKEFKDVFMILLYDFIIFSDLPTHIENLGNVFISVECRNPTLAECGGEAQHLEKVGIGVLRDSRMFRARQQGPKHLALRCSWCH